MNELHYLPTQEHSGQADREKQKQQQLLLQLVDAGSTLELAADTSAVVVAACTELLAAAVGPDVTKQLFEPVELQQCLD
ncbi:hypothetical protein E2C01_003503 [Portunus trituberculatus]|uniref:Uncharacterized protein n=1 Tax=Portunus trituberculatus TaxID=210409 RepID=A0A5B7CMZ4_PORTR|nr:hypothetical protein [Portunus trituberculatus]